MIRSLLFATTTLLALTVGASALRGQAPTKTTNSGVYTAAQADRGKQVFSASCTACHDTARFTGDIFMEAFDGKPMKDVWDIASGTMPEDNPGSLKQQEYADILAFFLQLNGFPTGDAELPPGAASMALIKIEKKQAIVARQTTSVKAGVYTAAQADRGIVLFKSKCASCHAPNRFTDDLFYSSFAGKPMWELFDVISDSMPEDNPGSLEPEEYADVIAYLLKLNNFPAGADDLPASKEALSAIMMEKP